MELTATMKLACAHLCCARMAPGHRNPPRATAAASAQRFSPVAAAPHSRGWPRARRAPPTRWRGCGVTGASQAAGRDALPGGSSRAERRPGNSTSGRAPERKESVCPHKTLGTHVHGNIMHDGQKNRKTPEPQKWPIEPGQNSLLAFT